MTRYSSTVGALGVALLIAAPWVDLAIRIPVYAIGVASLAAAVISRLLND